MELSATSLAFTCSSKSLAAVDWAAYFWENKKGRRLSPDPTHNNKKIETNLFQVLQLSLQLLSPISLTKLLLVNSQRDLEVITL